MTPLERFLNYVKFYTTSDEESDTVPSAMREKDLGEYLVKELKEIGLEDVVMDKYGYVYGFLPASKGCEKSDAIALIAHMDTAPSAPGENVNPQIVKYSGGSIVLKSGVEISPYEYPSLNKYVGQELITSDGTTLLGADDKAGITEIITAAEYLKNNPDVKHGKIALCFTPDEEIGRGADFVDIKKLGCDYGFTVDGGELGEINYENFNGAALKVTVNGVNIHPGSAKDKMKNSVLIANEFLSLLPQNETPAHTCDREGFYHVCDIKGDETKTVISIIIRDHDKQKFENRKTFAKECADFINKKYGENTLVADISDSYYNMGEKVEDKLYIVENVKKAMENCSVKPYIEPIRGGTDGARLSFDGLICPNICTGGVNFHSVREFIPVSALKKVSDILVELIKLSV